MEGGSYVEGGALLGHCGRLGIGTQQGTIGWYIKSMRSLRRGEESEDSETKIDMQLERSIRELD